MLFVNPDGLINNRVSNFKSMFNAILLDVNL